MLHARLARLSVARTLPRTAGRAHALASVAADEPAAAKPVFKADAETGADASDAEVVAALMTGALKHHNLEHHLGDAVRAVRLRRLYIEASGAAADQPSKDLGGLPVGDIDPAAFYQSVLGTNCENVIGFVPLPVGIFGPLLLDGKGYTVPLATTEGALIASVNRGARAVSAAGGVVSAVLADGMTRAPVVGCVDLPQAAALKQFFESPEKFKELQTLFSQTSRFGQLTGVKVALAGRHAFIRFRCSTGDAMGMNMVGKGTNAVLGEALAAFPGAELLALSGNYCTDKKAAAVNWIEGRGKSVACEALIPGAIVRSVLKADVQRVTNVNTQKNLVGSALAGALGGYNAHAANMVAAIFLACGQDPAQVVESAQCITTIEAVPAGGNAAAATGAVTEPYDLRIACTMPAIEVGTVGGGTSLPGQAACLRMLGVAGASQETAGANAQQLARLVCATVLCGELSLIAALSSNHLISAHLALNRKPSA